MRTSKLTIDKKPYEVEVKAFNLKEATLVLNGKTMIVKVDEVLNAQSPLLQTQSEAAPPPKAAPKPAPKPAPARPATAPAPTPVAGSALKAPIPGAILTVDVAEGDTVEAGQLVLKMEAMKMENQIKAAHAGKVVQILVAPGDAVAQGQDLVIIE